MLPITPTVAIDENEIRLEFVHASGPGGQNVNKVATAVQLRFDVKASRCLTDTLKQRIVRLAGKRVTSDGVLIIDARTFRSQARNRADAFERLAGLIRKAAEPPRRRRKTRRPFKSKQQRLDAKKHRGEIKRRRSAVRHEL